MNTASVIDRLGGNRLVAQLCNVTPPAVSMWRKSGIPPQYWLGLVSYAKDHDIDGITFEAVESARAACRMPKPKRRAGAVGR